MNRFNVILLLGLILSLTGCSTTPDIKYSDLQPATTATISGSTVIIHLGGDKLASACWTRPKVKVKGQTVYVLGYLSFRAQNKEFIVHLPQLANTQEVSVVWVDPDGSHVTVPIIK
jgi:hypothetical protein